jgi:hypothetical protein
MPRLLLKIGGYPMVGGSTQGKNLMTYEPDLGDWSRVLMVRFPSRRAFLSLLADPAYGPLQPYKMMALKVVIVPVSGEVVIPEMRAVVGGALPLPGGGLDPGCPGEIRTAHWESLEPGVQLLRDAFLVSSPYRNTSQARTGRTAPKCARKQGGGPQQKLGPGRAHKSAKN